MSFDKTSRSFASIKVTLMICVVFFMVSCQQQSSSKKSERSANKTQRNIVKLHSKGTFSEVARFLYAYNQGLSLGVCEMFFSTDGLSDEPCIMTRNGKAYLIIKVNNDKGFRVSKLKLINRNKFINLDDDSLWYLEPYH